MRNKRRFCLAAGVLIFPLVFSVLVVEAVSANISRSYRANTRITDASIVSIDPSRSDYVEPANTTTGNRILGVAVASNDSLLAVNASPDTIQVALSGNANTLVSDLNGDIAVGDQVAVSPFNGVGMKALPGSKVVGLAQSAFRGGAGATNQEVTDKDGHKTRLALGYVRVSISIGTAAAGTGSGLNGLQRITLSLTGRAVSTGRIIISLVVIVVAILSLVTLMYASIYGSIISIGRNPLAKYAVFRTLSSVMGMAALVAVISVVVVFLLLH